MYFWKELLAVLWKCSIWALNGKGFCEPHKHQYDLQITLVRVNLNSSPNVVLKLFPDCLFSLSKFNEYIEIKYLDTY